MTTSTASRPRTTAVIPPRLGGFNPTLLRIEALRVFRNRRTVVFTLVVPVLFFLMFGTDASYVRQSAGHGNVVAFVMVSMAAYGALIASTGGGASVATERALGWSRQLRLTPLTPAAYVMVKVLLAMSLGAISVVAVFTAGALGSAHMDEVWRWTACALLAWVGSLVFAAFGLFMGYLLPSENVMQLIGPGLAVLAFLGGLFMPLQDGSTLEVVARFTPMYGIGRLAHAPLTGDPVQWWWIANVVAWFAVFAGGAAWRFRRDTARV